jgi:hypothetical protein
MGIYRSTYVAYGVHVPGDKYEGSAWQEGERLDSVIYEAGLKETDVGHMTAGAYDRDELFIVCSPPYDRDDPTTHVQIELGSWRSYPASWFQSPERFRWDDLIDQVVTAAWYGDLGEPGWIVVPNES